ncbi:MAG: MBL fold metallo-hydrolase [Rhizobiales bacterium]|nr:MBL fold metallo-hydrolase [Hyphomicrobiales bacterium]
MPHLPVADHWFDSKTIGDGITLLWEPHVVPLMRCNIWHVRGRDRDLLIDTGMGIASLRDAAKNLLGAKVTAVATHTHSDHIGGHHEFDDTMVHKAEAAALAHPDGHATLRRAEMPTNYVAAIERSGYHVEETLITALPSADYDIDAYGIKEAVVTQVVMEGDVVDLGNRHFEVLHLPGHSPGSMGLWEAATATLFSGDAIYDGPLLDEIEGADIPAYLHTMKRLRELPVEVVHAGHDPSFGRARLIELADAYIRQRS